MPDTLEAAKELAKVLADEGHYAEAEEWGRVTLDVARRALEPGRPQTMNAIETLANILSHASRYEERAGLIAEKGKPEPAAKTERKRSQKARR